MFGLNPVTLATNLGITLDLNKLQEQDLERDSLESEILTSREASLSDQDRGSFLETFQEQDIKELENIGKDLAKSISQSDNLGKPGSPKIHVGQNNTGQSFER